MNSNHVLIVDDDPSIQRLLSKVMHSNLLTCDIASSGEEALSLIPSHDYALILMDITMEGIDGFDVIEQIRRNGISTPIIVVSGRSEDYDTLYGLELGADDYITKPFNPVILGAKVKALIRRSQQQEGKNASRIVCGPFVFDNHTLRLTKKGQDIPLSAKETRLIAFFMQHPGQIFSKTQLYRQVWDDILPDENAVTVYINHLRSKIEDTPRDPRYLLTVWGLGYKFVAD